MPEPDFSQVFHHSSKSHQKGHPPISLNPAEWPDEWKTPFFKTYPRLPKMPLDGDRAAADFFDLIKTRQSRRDFHRVPLSLKELGTVLRYSCGEADHSANYGKGRVYPSAGGRYPIEIYPLVLRGGDAVPSGLYHYNVLNHALDVLWDREFSDFDIDQMFGYPWLKEASVVLVMTAVFWRNQNKYGERGYRYVLLEAGHIGQNVYLTSEALGVSCCALAGTRDENLEKLIDIDGTTESVIYAIALGK